MDAQQFLSEFGHIANAPGGVAQLRELVLQLAIQGRLVNAKKVEEHSSSELLEAVRIIRSKLISEKKLPREKPFPEISAREIPVDSPKHWNWVRFGELWHLLSGRDLTPSQYNESKNGIPYITGASNIENGSISVNRWTPTPVVVSVKDDLLITCKGTIGKTAFNTIGDVHIARQIMAIRNFSERLNTGFLKIWLDGFVGQLIAKSKSMIPGFSRDDLIHAIYPIPPIEEQARIVTKVDELMVLCDKHEAQQLARQKLCDLTRTTVFQVLGSARSPQDLFSAWQRVSEHAALLLDAPESVDSYRSAILDLAMAGLLLPSSRKIISTGHELLEMIENQRTVWSRTAEDQEQKEALAMLKKIRVQKIEPPDASLPEHWTWGSFLQISQAVVDCHNKTAPYVHEGIHLIRTTDIRNGRMILKNTRKVSPETYAFWSRRMPPRSGDVFFTREAPMGEAAIVPEGETVCLGQRTMLLRLFPELFNNQFLVYAIYSPSFQTRMVEAAIGMTVKHLRVGGVEDLMIPVPPKDEQDQIVAIIDQLFSHCEQLAQNLARKQKMGSNLAKSSIEALTGIRSEEEEELKTPKTELIAKLRLGESPNIKEQAPLAAILAQQNGEMAAKDLWQRFGKEIDAFYDQLKLEVSRGWILEPAVAEMHEVEAK